MKLAFRLPTFGRSIDWLLYILPILLVGIGIATIISLTFGTGRTSLATNQGIYAVIGVVAMVVFTRIDYRNWRGAAYVFYGAVVALLLGVAFFGVTIFGAKRWLELPGFQLQPSELAKLAIVVLLARFFADRDELGWRDYLLLGGIISLPVGLIMLQPDLGTAMIVLITSFGLLIAGGIPKRALGTIIGAGLLSLPIGWQFLADYQKQRVLTFLNPEADPYGSGYNVLQALIAVGSGGMLGQGLGQGTQSQQQFLPVAHTDFIFAGVAEATGFVGAITLIVLLAFLVLRVRRAAQYSKDRFGFLLAVGVGLLLLSQMAINISMNVGLAPVTGIPLPFVSHGGTALITNFVAIGIIQSIVLRHKKITF